MASLPVFYVCLLYPGSDSCLTLHRRAGHKTGLFPQLMILPSLKAEDTELNCLPKPAVTLESRSSKALQAGRRTTYDGSGAIKSKHLVGSGWSLLLWAMANRSAFFGGSPGWP